MSYTNVHFWTIGTFLLLPATFLFSYLISVYRGDVYPYFPYISDTGTRKPESCIFGQLINMVAILLAFNVYIRKKYVECNLDDYHISPEKGHILNKVSFISGIIACFGLTLVANFQETEVFVVHVIGAIAAFSMGISYMWIQTVLTFKMISFFHHKRWIAYARLVITTLMTLFFFVVMICGLISYRTKPDDPTKWSPSMPGYNFHLASTISEWLCALALDFFILTYAFEFHRINCMHVCLILLPYDINYSNMDDNVDIIEETRASIDTQTASTIRRNQSTSQSIVPDFDSGDRIEA